MTRRDIVQKPLHELLGRSNLNSVLNYTITKDDCVFGNLIIKSTSDFKMERKENPITCLTGSI